MRVRVRVRVRVTVRVRVRVRGGWHQARPRSACKVIALTVGSG